MCLHVSRTFVSSDIWLKLPDLALSLLTFQIPFLGSFLFSFLTVQQMKNTSNLMFLLNLFIFFYLLCKPCFPVCHLLITICNLKNECLSGYAFKSFHTYGSSILFAYSSLGSVKSKPLSPPGVLWREPVLIIVDGMPDAITTSSSLSASFFSLLFIIACKPPLFL